MSDTWDIVKERTWTQPRTSDEGNVSRSLCGGNGHFMPNKSKVFILRAHPAATEGPSNRPAGHKGSGPGHVCSRQHAPAGLRHERTHEEKSDKILLCFIYIIQEANGGKGINTGQNRTKPYVYMTMIKNQGGNCCETTLSGKSLQGSASDVLMAMR